MASEPLHRSTPNAFRALFPSASPIIGVVHLLPLPGFSGSPGVRALIDRALRDLETLEAGGVDGVLVENEHDRPHEVCASARTVAAMTQITAALVRAARTVTVGVEILLNDPKASVAVAAMTGARFIRTDYFVDRMMRAEYGGEMAIDPAGLLEHRHTIGASDVLILADIQVKYATLIEPVSLVESAAAARAHGADAIIVTGTATGVAPGRAEVEAARAGAGSVPILIGSGIDPSNAVELIAAADGAIVGTSLQGADGVDATRVDLLMRVVRAAGRR
jgi:hypothetical protein